MNNCNDCTLTALAFVETLDEIKKRSKGAVDLLQGLEHENDVMKLKLYVKTAQGLFQDIEWVTDKYLNPRKSDFT